MNVPFRRYWKLLATYLRPQWRRAILLALLLFSSIGLQLAGPQILRVFIDTAQAGGALRRLANAALLFLGVAVLTQGAAVAETYVAESIGWTATNQLRADLALHCLRLDHAFHSRRTPGELIERIDGDVSALAGFFSRFVIAILGNVLLLAGVLALLYRVDWRIGLTASIFAAVTTLAMLRLYSIAQPLWTAVRQASALFFGALGEVVAGTEDIRSSGATAFVQHRFALRFRHWAPLVLKATFAEQRVWMVALSLFALANAASLTVGTTLLHQGTISLGTVYLIFQYFSLLSRPIGELQAQIQQFQQAGASIGRVEELFQMHSRVPDGRKALPTGALAVALEGVSFAYDTQKPAVEPVLRDISLALAPGMVLGLLGRTGSGKSTLVRLLVRFFDPTAGSVRLGGVDLRDVARADLRRRVGMVTQEVQLFQGTVRDNLTFFKRTIPDERLLTAIDSLSLTDWLAALPDGLNTELSAQRGLSAGQAQLLALVRVFLKDPALVILDEASSRLDPLTEVRLDRAITNLLHGRTAIIIAHRLAAIERADALVILDAGRIVEQGTREALANDPRSRFAVLQYLDRTPSPNLENTGRMANASQ
ncbi:MAG: ABC transporter ATP-binding protein [Chloroflexota bacterium]